jgi:hypothetical protein
MDAVAWQHPLLLPACALVASPAHEEQGQAAINEAMLILPCAAVLPQYLLQDVLVAILLLRGVRERQLHQHSDLSGDEGMQVAADQRVLVLVQPLVCHRTNVFA